MTNRIHENEPYVFNCDGEALAKVLIYYGYEILSSVFKIVCPFHQDVNPSLVVDLTEGRWYCFGCGLSGDALKFVSLLNPSLDDLHTTLKYFQILKSDKVEKLKLHYKKERVASSQLYDEAHDYFYGLSAVDWIHSEGEEIDECRKYMFSRGFSAKTLTKCDARITYNTSYPIIFPMLDNGEFKGWVCRTNKPEIEKVRKYLYNKGFSRATTLVGQSKNNDVLFVVEGFMDRLKFIQYGIDNVVAILGWKLSQQQEEKIRQGGAKIIVSALDNDDCGRKGTKYLKKCFPGQVVRFSYLKGIKDVGETDLQTFTKMYEKTKQQIIMHKKALKDRS